MKSYKNKLLNIFLITIFITISHAAELQQGVQYNGGDYLTASKAGISFTLPQGWSGSVSDDGDFVMKSSQHYGLLMLTASATNNRQDMAKSLSHESIDIGSGFVFYPSGNANIESNGVTQSYQGKDPASGSALQGHLHVLEGDFNQSVTIVVMGTANDANYNNQLLHNTLNTVSFFNPQGTSQQTEQYQQNKAVAPSQQRRPVIENWSDGGYVEGVNRQGQNCSYVTAAGMTMKSCD